MSFEKLRDWHDKQCNLRMFGEEHTSCVTKILHSLVVSQDALAAHILLTRPSVVQLLLQDYKKGPLKVLLASSLLCRKKGLRSWTLCRGAIGSPCLRFWSKGLEAQRAALRPGEQPARTRHTMFIVVAGISESLPLCHSKSISCELLEDFGLALLG